MTLFARIVYLIGGFVVSILTLRFIFVLFGANPNNIIADFIYSVSQPFVRPFFGLFSYDPTLGNARFEWETLIAMLVYAMITGILVRVTTVTAD